MTDNLMDLSFVMLGRGCQGGWGWAGQVACMGMMRSIYVLVRKPETKRLFGRPSHRWVDNNGMDLEK
jgi:hypothetical protein